MLVLTILAAVFGFNYRRSGGPGWAFFMPLAMVAMVGDPDQPGFAGIRGAHVFWGVLYLCVATAFCSYTWRHRRSDKGQGTTSAASTRWPESPADDAGVRNLCIRMRVCIRMPWRLEHRASITPKP